MVTKTLEQPTSTATLYRRAATGALTERFKRAGGKASLPELQLELAEVEIDRSHVAAYGRVCNFPLRDELPATYLHNLTFPLATELMTSDEFPFPIIGMVHVENRIEQLRPVTADERPTLRLHLADLRPHRAGTQFDVIGEAEIDGEIVWRDVSTYLKRHATASGAGSSPGRRGKVPPPRPEAIWTLPGDLGRQFAAVSGDSNPIHMSPWAAKLFGMPGAIAHGMWLKARCLAALDKELPEAFAIEVAFQRPVQIPGRVSFATATIDGRRTFTLHHARSGAPHLRGSIAPL